MVQAYRDIFSLPRTVWMLFFVATINRMGTMVVPFLALYANQVLKLSPADAGLVVTLYGVGSLCAGIVSGWLSDRLGAVRVLIVTLFIAAFLIFTLSTIENRYLFVFVAFLMALANESFRPALLALAAEFGPREKQRQTFALVRLSANLGMSIGPAIGGFVFVYSPHLLFWLNGLAAASAGSLLWVAKRRGVFPSTHIAHEDRLSLWKSLQIAYSDKRLVWVLLAFFPASLVLFQHESSLPLILTQAKGFNEADYGMIFTVNTLLIIAMEIWITSSTVRHRAGAVMAVGSLLVGLGFALIGVVETRLELQLMTVVWTFGEMLLFPVAVSYVSEISNSKNRGSYMAAYGASVSLTLIFAPLIGLNVWQFWGLTEFSLFCLGAGVLSALLCWRAR